jgi:hypothetical protein
VLPISGVQSNQINVLSHEDIVHPAMPALRYYLTMNELRLAPTSKYFGIGDPTITLCATAVG